jgi:hypothetical protein
MSIGQDGALGDRALVSAAQAEGEPVEDAFWLVIKRITVVGGIWITAELAHHLQLF